MPVQDFLGLLTPPLIISAARMGIHSREYYRSTKPSPWSFAGAPVITGLIVVNAIVFLLQILITQPMPVRAARVSPGSGTRPAVNG